MQLSDVLGVGGLVGALVLAGVTLGAALTGNRSAARILEAVIEILRRWRK